MPLPDPRQLTAGQRAVVAERVKASHDVELPRLKYWNYDLCTKHRHGWIETYFDPDLKQDLQRRVTDRPAKGCQECGIHFRRHQRLGINWLFFRGRCLLADSVGTGKSLRADQRVLTPTGWVQIGQLAVGAKVIDPAGEASEVLGVFPQGELPAYRVSFSDGTSVVTSGDHLWTTRPELKPSQSDGWRTWSTDQIAAYLLRRPGRRLFLPTVAPPNLDNDQPRPVDPYLLGLLLGDGGLTQNTPRFFSADPELFEAIADLVPPGVSVRPIHGPTRCSAVSLPGPGRQDAPNPLTVALRELGCFGKTARFKSVPEAYLFAPVEIRRDILAGLMDTDGSADARQGALEFGTSSPQLAEDVAFLVRSLGGRAKILYRPQTESYRVSIGQLSVAPFRLRRKLEAFRAVRSPLLKAVVSINPVESAEMVCIKVSAPSELFVTEGWTPTHNTTQGAGLLALVKENGELDNGSRIIVVCRAPALSQWARQLRRMIPSMGVTVSIGSKRQRIQKYSDPWDIVLTSPQMLLNDYQVLDEYFQFNTVLVDDVDPLRNRDTQTAYVLKHMGARAERFVVMTGTPLQKRLHELYSVLEPLGGREVFGTEHAFKTRYVRSEKVIVYNPKTGRKNTIDKVVGYKNVDEFVQKLSPFALRRTAADITDVDLPEIVPNTVELELYPRQREHYEALKKGVLEIARAEGIQVKQVAAMGRVLYGAKICGGLATLGEPDGPQASVKLDWVLDKVVDGDLSDEKVVIFAGFKDTLRALQARLTAVGVGWEVIWGDEPNALVRDKSQQRFWNDPTCRILMGTQSIEQSLNLQVARHLINIDMILNPARMEQLAGRIRRDGSAHSHVFVHNLLTNDTQEQRYLPLLEREQALIDRVWDEQSELFEALSPLALLSLITG